MTKAMCMRVSHMSWASVNCWTLRNTCSRWIDEIATMVEATLILSEPASILPSHEISLPSALSKRLTKFS